MELNNRNKHEKLTPQSRTETRELRIESQGATMSLSGNANETVGPGASISVGGATILGTQQIDAHKAPIMVGNGKQTITIWVSFNFDENGEEVLCFLGNAVACTEQIVNELSVL